MSRCELDWTGVGYAVLAGSYEIQVSIKEVDFLESRAAVSV
jgi:hypothetical protein